MDPAIGHAIRPRAGRRTSKEVDESVINTWTPKRDSQSSKRSIVKHADATSSTVESSWIPSSYFKRAPCSTAGRELCCCTHTDTQVFLPSFLLFSGRPTPLSVPPPPPWKGRPCIMWRARARVAQMTRTPLVVFIIRITPYTFTGAGDC